MGTCNTKGAGAAASRCAPLEQNMNTTPAGRQGAQGSAAHDLMYVTVDIFILRLHQESSQVQILLVKRRNDPGQGMWAIPGGFVNLDESLEAAARRELGEETHLEGLPMLQLQAFGDPGRDPRYRVVSIAYFAFLRGDAPAQADDDAAEVGWFGLPEVPPLAFDHTALLTQVIGHLAARLADTATALSILPGSFTLAEARHIVDALLKAQQAN